ncbi:GIY-YIG nuclease family protein [Radiobacillus sp. PE A8.2]|uniref:GIY-YIG nuclease family protein n=1 Tax=Radiobacillus sp. PE A8.2 TaxID=3380349 RepID=UPI00388F822D
MGDKTDHSVYILECSDGTLYTGYTNDFERRLVMHEQGKGAKYTRGRGPFHPVFKQTYASKREALQTEYKIKQMNREQKLALIKMHAEGLDKDANAK